jgi:hypothetical protein
VTRLLLAFLVEDLLRVASGFCPVAIATGTTTGCQLLGICHRLGQLRRLTLVDGLLLPAPCSLLPACCHHKAKLTP